LFDVLRSLKMEGGMRKPKKKEEADKKKN